MKSFVLEVIVDVDDDEVATEELCEKKKVEISKVVESINPAIGVFMVNSITEG